MARRRAGAAGLNGPAQSSLDSQASDSIMGPVLMSLGRLTPPGLRPPLMLRGAKAADGWFIEPGLLTHPRDHRLTRFVPPVSDHASRHYLRKSAPIRLAGLES